MTIMTIHDQNNNKQLLKQGPWIRKQMTLMFHYRILPVFPFFPSLGSMRSLPILMLTIWVLSILHHVNFIIITPPMHISLFSPQSPHVNSKITSPTELSQAQMEMYQLG